MSLAALNASREQQAAQERWIRTKNVTAQWTIHTMSRLLYQVLVVAHLGLGG